MSPPKAHAYIILWKLCGYKAIVNYLLKFSKMQTNFCSIIAKIKCDNVSIHFSAF